MDCRDLSSGLVVYLRGLRRRRRGDDRHCRVEGEDRMVEADGGLAADPGKLWM